MTGWMPDCPSVYSLVYERPCVFVVIYRDISLHPKIILSLFRFSSLSYQMANVWREIGVNRSNIHLCWFKEKFLPVKPAKAREKPWNRAQLHLFPPRMPHSHKCWNMREEEELEELVCLQDYRIFVLQSATQTTDLATQSHLSMCVRVCSLVFIIGALPSILPEFLRPNHVCLYVCMDVRENVCGHKCIHAHISILICLPCVSCYILSCCY